MVKVTLTGEDKSGPAFKSMQQNIAQTTKELEKFLGYGAKEVAYWKKRANDINQFYDVLIANQAKNKKALDDAAESARKHNTEGAAGLTKQTSAAKGFSRELEAMVGGYLSLGAAVGTATKAFMGFADTQRKISQLRNATDATRESAAAAIETIKQIGQETAVGFEDANEAVTNLRETMGLTMAQATKMLPQVLLQAQASNAAVGSFSKSFGDYMRNTKTPMEDYGKALEMMTYTASKLDVNLDKLAPNMAKLGEVGARWGYEGTKGMATLNVMAAEASKAWGDANKGGKATINLLQELGSDQVGQAMNKPAGMWRKELEKVKKEGKFDVVGYAISKYSQLLTVEQRRKVLSEETFMLTERFLEKNNGQMYDMIKDVQKAGEGYEGLAKGVETAGDAQGSINRLTAAMKGLLDTTGAFLDKIGVTNAITIFTEKLNDLNEVIDNLSKGEWGKVFKPKYEMHWPTPAEVGRGMLGMDKTDIAKDKLQKRLEENMTPAQRRQLRIEQEKRGVPATGGVTGGTYQPSSFSGPTPSGGLMGGGQAIYGGSADSAYLPASFRSGGGGGGGGGGGVQNASLITQGPSGAGPATRFGPAYQNAGPNGYGGGTSYGGQKDIPVGGGGMPVVPQAGGGGGASGVPSAILAKAQEVAAMGGPGAVSQFMAQQGYPKAGAWCGQFAASVVKASGGTPPANPQVASNWRNFGTKVDNPQPGDIAVKIGSRFGGGRTPTGSAGSHVTMVSSVGQGTFAGLGGNQGGGRLTTSNFGQSGYEFFRGGAAGGAAQPGAGGQAVGGLNQGAYAQLFGGTKMQGQEGAIQAAAQKHGISPALLAGIIAHESGKGTSRFINQMNNPAGLMDPKQNWMKGQQFGTIGEGIEASARTIAKNLARGGGSIEGMAKLYAPVGAANDPRGQNASWAGGVRGYMARLGGGALGGGATDVSARARMTASAAPPAAAASDNSEQLRKMGFVYDPDTGKPLRQFDPYTGAKLASGGNDGVKGSAAGGIAPGIAAERERRSKEATDKDVAREKELRKEISDTQNAGIASRKNIYGGEAAPQGGARRAYSGELGRIAPASRGVGGEAAPMGGAGRRGPLSRIAPRTKGVGGEAAPEGGMPEPPHLAQERRFREVQEITERQDARREQTRTDEMNERARDAGARVGRGKDPVNTIEEASQANASERAYGGPVTGGSPYLVGEKGPELFRPHMSGQIVPNSSMNINMNVNDAHVQFARASISRQADREVREARWNSYSDIGAA